jgi:hypothetical protein
MTCRMLVITAPLGLIGSDKNRPQRNLRDHCIQKAMVWLKQILYLAKYAAFSTSFSTRSTAS